MRLGISILNIGRQLRRWMIGAIPAAFLMAIALVTITHINTTTVFAERARSEIATVIGLALKSSRLQLRDARQVCDAHYQTMTEGNIAGTLGLANCFKAGAGRQKSLLRARELFALAASQGSAEAHLALGQFYLDGRIVAKDVNRAAEHLRFAARAGLSSAMVEYGLTLLRTKTDHDDACRWFARSTHTRPTGSSSNTRDGIRLLGDCFARGIGRHPNAETADELYRLAASLGDGTAALKLAGYPFTGAGSDIAAQEGCDWAAEAAKRTNQEAAQAVAFCLKAQRIAANN